ncbi:hypothetical protein QOZ80_3BG0267410 [Eleusine coracana subsp. coracana]|nr:hypothetical protein QOZ80_3BG0267410 [Eleusine coracana subsp. coracana]
MARSHPTLLLLVVLLAAGAHQSGNAAKEARLCPEPESVATGVALFCAGRLPTQPCCQALAQAGAGCLCLVASEPPLADAALNGTDLITLYAGCGLHGRAAAATRLASSSCDAVPGGGGSGPCSSLTITDQMSVFCAGRTAAPPIAGCCEAVAVGARDAPCFCRAARMSHVGARGVVGLYAACGGLRTGLVTQLAESCARLPKA